MKPISPTTVGSGCGSSSVTAFQLGASVISEAPSWKAVTDEDPHPDPTVVGDMGFIQGTLFGWMLPFRDAVLAGDRARVEHLLVAGSYDRGSTCDAPDPDWFAIYGRHARDSSWTDNKE